MGCVVVTNIFCWTNGHAMIPMIGTFSQTIWWNSCVCQITTRAVTTSTNSTSCWKPNLCEGYVVVPIGLKVGWIPILNLLWLDSKHELIQMYSNQQLVMIKKAE